MAKRRSNQPAKAKPPVKAPMTPAGVSKSSPELFPNDHVRMLLELLRISGGGGAALARRWVVALLTVPATERRALVEEIESRIAEVYGEEASDAMRPGRTEDDEQLLHVSGEPVQRAGYVEQVVRSYAASQAPVKKSKSKKKSKRSSA